MLTVSSDDVIATDKTSKEFTPSSNEIGKKQDYDSKGVILPFRQYRSVFASFQNILFLTSGSNFFHFGSDRTIVTSGNG